MTDPPFVGPQIQVPGRFTHCVDRTAYHGPPGILDALFSLGPGGAGKAAFEYLLGGKLVCLDVDGKDRCAFGTIVHIEPVGYDKSGFELIDNDFCFNVLLAPWLPHDLGTDGFANVTRVAQDEIQGDLHADPLREGGPPLPTPREPADNATDAMKKALGLNNVGYTAKYPHASGEVQHLPVLHAECEGSRIFLVAGAMAPFLDILEGKVPGSGLPSASEICHATLDWLPWGIGDAVCSIVETVVAVAVAVFAPWFYAAMAAVFGAAWAAAQVYDDAFYTGPVSKKVAVGENVLITGRWVWDGGHAGYTEFHPVKTIQKILVPEALSHGVPTTPDGKPEGPLAEAARDFRDRWCHFVLEGVPATWPGPELLFEPGQPGPDLPGVPEVPDLPKAPELPGSGLLTDGQLAALTPPQRATYRRLRDPVHSWTIHPCVDGCQDDDQPPHPSQGLPKT